METTLHLNYYNADRMTKTMDSLFQSMRSSLEYSADTLSDDETSTPKQVDDNLELMRNSSNYFNSIAVLDADGLIRNVVPTSLGSVGNHITSKVGLEALALKNLTYPPLHDPNHKETNRFYESADF